MRSDYVGPGEEKNAVKVVSCGDIISRTRTGSPIAVNADAGRLPGGMSSKPLLNVLSRSHIGPGECAGSTMVRSIDRAVDDGWATWKAMYEEEPEGLLRLRFK